MAYVTDQQPESTGAMSRFKYDADLEAAFWFTPKFGDKINVSLHKDGSLYVPRNLVPIGKQDFRVSHAPIAINCKCGPRTDEQKDLIAECVHLLTQGTSHIVEAPTGFGKTYVGTAAAAEMGQPTLIIVTKEDLVKSWRDTLTKLIGVPADKIGYVQQDVCEFKGKLFVIAMVHSLIIPGKYPPELYNYFGLVIFDEVHRMAADEFVKACHILPAKLRLGLSATTGRSDGRWPIIEAHIGPVMVRGTTVPMIPKILVKKTGWQIPKVPVYKKGIFMGVKTIPYAPGKMMSVTKLQGEDYARNSIIVEFVEQAYKAGRTTLILSDLVDGHLKILFHRLAKVMPAEKIDYYIGGRTESQLETAKKAKVVLATYAFTSEGTDVPHWDTLVLATPRANVTQSIGRVMRLLEGKKEPVVLDLVDSDGIFGGYYLGREKQYYKIGAKIVKL